MLSFITACVNITAGYVNGTINDVCVFVWDPGCEQLQWDAQTY